MAELQRVSEAMREMQKVSFIKKCYTQVTLKPFFFQVWEVFSLQIARSWENTVETLFCDFLPDIVDVCPKFTAVPDSFLSLLCRSNVPTNKTASD